MFVVARDRIRGETRVHYLPEGGVLTLDDVLLSRTGDVVILQTDKEKFTLEAPSSVNLTSKLLAFIPFRSIIERAKGENAIETLQRLEEMAFEEELPHDARKFIRLYAALLGLEIMDHVPTTLLESIVLSISRLTGERIGDIIAHRDGIKRKIERELDYTLRSLPPDVLTSVVNTVIAV